MGGALARVPVRVEGFGGGRAAPLLDRIVERHELRLRRILAESLRQVRRLTADGPGPLYSRSAHRSEYPPGTLGRCARATLALCEVGEPVAAPGHLVRG
ncbi:MAG TPA: hypothetical protein VGC32_00205 [Solirubrobacterales bacterium]